MIAKYPPGSIHPDYRPGLKLAVSIALSIAQNDAENERVGADPGLLYVFADIAAHLAQGTDH
jgi:hypothetical protein